jgi:Ca2+-binding RTX toxin-like protein
LYGGADSDYLSGGAGDDVLNGREPSMIVTDPTKLPVLGTDRLLGGDGNDTVMADAGDYALGGKGMDTLDIRIEDGSSPSPYIVYSLDFSKVTGKKAVDIGYKGIKAGQFEKVQASVSDMDVGSVVTGSKGDDSISGYGKSGVINGGAGDDTLWASGYNADNPANGIVVIGGAGDDKLSGDGDVTLVGGKGDDQFILTPSAQNTIADFSGKDYFLVHASRFQHYDYDLKKYVTPTFDMNNLLVVGTDPKPATGLPQFFYDTDDGKLYYDADGTGLNYDLQLLTTLANKAALKASDFVFVN